MEPDSGLPGQARGTADFFSSLKWQNQQGDQAFGTAEMKPSGSDDSDDEFARELEQLRLSAGYRAAPESSAHADDFFGEREGAGDADLGFFDRPGNADGREDVFGDFDGAGSAANVDLFESSGSNQRAANSVDLLGLANGGNQPAGPRKATDDLGVDLLNLSPNSSRDSQNVDLFSGTEDAPRGMRRNRSADDILNPPHDDQAFRHLSSHSSGCSAEDVASLGERGRAEFDPFGSKRDSASSPELFDPLGGRASGSSGAAGQFDLFRMSSSGSKSPANLGPPKPAGSRSSRSSGSSPTFDLFADQAGRASDTSPRFGRTAAGESQPFDPFASNSGERSGTGAPTFGVFGPEKANGENDLFNTARTTPASGTSAADLLGGWGGGSGEPAGSTLQPQKAPSPTPGSSAGPSLKNQARPSSNDPFADLGSFGAGKPSGAAPRFPTPTASPSTQRQSTSGKSTSGQPWSRPGPQPSRQPPKAPAGSPSQAHKKPNYNPVYSAPTSGSVFGAYGLKTNYGACCYSEVM